MLWILLLNEIHWYDTARHVADILLVFLCKIIKMLWLAAIDIVPVPARYAHLFGNFMGLLIDQNCPFDRYENIGGID